MSSYLKKRGQRYHFQKRVPDSLKNHIPKPLIQISLFTDSESIAQQRALMLNQVIEDLFDELRWSDGINASAKLQNVLSKAKKSRFRILPLNEEYDTRPLSQIVNHINQIEFSVSTAGKEALIQGTQTGNITLSQALDSFIEYEQANLSGLSENQKRKWRNPRKKAVSNLINLIGDKAVTDINRNDIHEFRQWWVERIQEEDMSTSSANKEFGFIRRMLNVVSDKELLDISTEALFKRIALKRVEKTRRQPFSKDFIRSVLLNKDIVRLNEEAHLLIFAMCDTGARIGELVGLEDEDVILDVEIPYIGIRPNFTRTLKTLQSERDIPLVGASRYAFQQLKGPFKHYHGKPDLISSVINKYLRENEILPSKEFSLYSLRHSFEDRLTAVEPPDKVQAALMGHKYSRPRYGDGPSLAQKKLWLDKIALIV